MGKKASTNFVFGDNFWKSTTFLKDGRLKMKLPVFGELVFKRTDVFKDWVGLDPDATLVSTQKQTGANMNEFHKKMMVEYFSQRPSFKYEGFEKNGKSNLRKYYMTGDGGIGLAIITYMPNYNISIKGWETISNELKGRVVLLIDKNMLMLNKVNRSFKGVLPADVRSKISEYF